MPKPKVREAIDDMLRRGLSDLDPVVALMRRGSVALDELALAAERPAVLESLTAVVRLQPQRFAAAVASLPRSVREHRLTSQLLAAAGGDALARAALVAWDQGRRTDAAFLAGQAVALGAESAEALVAVARAAGDAGQPNKAADLYESALALPISDSLRGEAASALFAAGRSELALTCLATAGDAALPRLIDIAADACLRGELRIVAAVMGDRPGLIDQISAVIAQKARGELASLAGAVGELRRACAEALADDPDTDAFASSLTLVTDSAARIADLTRLRCPGKATDAAPPSPEPAGPWQSSAVFGALRSGLTAALADAGEAVLRPVLLAIETISTDVRDAATALASATHQTGGDASDMLAMHRTVTRPLRTALERCDALTLYLGAVARPIATVVQSVAPVLEEVASRSRAMLVGRSISLQVTLGTTSPLKLDRNLLTDALTLAIADLAAAAGPGDCLSLSLSHDAGAGRVLIVVAGLGASTGLSPLAAALIDHATAVHGAAVALPSERSDCALRFQLPAPVPAATVDEFAGLTADARMAMRATAGLAAGDAETACFLIGKGVMSEAVARLKPFLARHLLLPRASWLLSSPVVKTGFTRAGQTVTGRKAEELCRAVVDDRLLRRLSDLRAYAFCLATFALPAGGWPSPATLPGLSDAEAASLVGRLAALSDLLESKAAGDALDVARNLFALLTKLGER